MSKKIVEGWAAVFNNKGNDNIIIADTAFPDDIDGKKVPLLWEHKYDSADKVVGHATLHRKKEGIWAKATFNNTAQGAMVQTIVESGDVDAFSMGIAQPVTNGNTLVHGNPFELSVVLGGANPNTRMISQSILPIDDEDDLGTMFYISSKNVLKQTVNDDELDDELDNELDELLLGLSDDELDKLDQLFDTDDEEVEQAVVSLLQSATNSDMIRTEMEKINMEKSAFSKNTAPDIKVTDTLKQSIANEVLTGTLSMQDVVLKQGITNIEVLFPEYTDPTPKLLEVQDPATQVLDIVQKVPRGQIRSRYINMTPDEYRANGYITGDEKVSDFVEVIGRKTTVQTIYKFEEVENDDLIDLEGNFDLINFYWSQMGIKIREEISRAIIVGDGRLNTDRHKIDPNQIRPIVSDGPAFTTQMDSSDPKIGTGPLKLEDMVRALAKIKASGPVTAFINRDTLTELCIQDSSKFQTQNGDTVVIPAFFLSADEIKNKLGVARLIVANFIEPNVFVASVLENYQLGTPKGGELKRHQDFVLKYNHHEFLLETRLGGAQTVPKSSVVLTKTP